MIIKLIQSFSPFYFIFETYIHKLYNFFIIFSLIISISYNLTLHLQTMNFIFNHNSLPFEKSTKKPEGYQYYQWRYKQKLQQEQEQLKKLNKYVQQIEQQQAQCSKDHRTKKHLHHHDDFYDYNLQWKKKVDKKIDQQKCNKQLQNAKQEQKAMKSQLVQEKKQLGTGYKGPIQGWSQHFQNYLRTKNHGLMVTPIEATFEPKINQRSRKMMQGITGKVQDRLIMFGQFIKMKTQEQINKANAQAGNFSFSHNSSNINQKYSSDQSNIFYRLYKEGEEVAKRKTQMANNDVCSFQPRINKLPQTLEDKVMKNRKPLYYVKTKDNNIINSTQSKAEASRLKQKSVKSDFEGFLKRNQALLELKKKMMATMRQQTEEKQNIQKSQCTFTPVLNNNSKKINRTLKQENKKFENKLKSRINQNQESSEKTQEQIQLQNIDISKLTVPDCKDSLCDQSDSLSIYKIGYEQKQSQKSLKKQQQSQNFVTKNTSINKYDTKPQKGHSYNTSSHSNFNAHTDICRSKTTKINQEQSFSKSNYEWESELNQIQNHIQTMMSRASK